jgi:hypothetical protein
MPNHESPSKCGHLFVEILIDYPEHLELSLEQEAALSSTLQKSSEPLLWWYKYGK